jgi:hypothetical protein
MTVRLPEETSILTQSALALAGAEPLSESLPLL